MSKPAVFLDRDGTLLHHYDYLTEPDQAALMPGTGAALRLLSAQGFLLVVVTNQSAVARGMLTEERLGDIHTRMKKLLAEQGAYVDKIYYCPYHPEAPVAAYRQDSELRKPKPGMLLLAAKELDIDLSRSWMIGDDDRDIEAGHAAGVLTIMLDSHSASRLVRRKGASADYRAVNLREAANHIVRYERERLRQQNAAATQPEPAAEPIGPAESIKEETIESQVQKEVSEKATEAPSSAQEPTASAAPEQSESLDIAGEKAVEQSPIVRTPPEELPTAGPQEETLIKKEDAAATEAATLEEPVAQSMNGAPQLKDKPRRIPPWARKESSGEMPTASERHTQKKTKSEGLSNQELLSQILRELKTMNREQGYHEFSAMKLFAAVAQMIAFLFLILAFILRTEVEPNWAQVNSAILGGVFFQLLTLTLLIMHRS